jgi:hypothetical protein
LATDKPVPALCCRAALPAESAGGEGASVRGNRRLSDSARAEARAKLLDIQGFGDAWALVLGTFSETELREYEQLIGTRNFARGSPTRFSWPCVFTSSRRSEPAPSAAN